MEPQVLIWYQSPPLSFNKQFNPIKTKKGVYEFQD